jgi:adenylate cyclase
MGDNVNLASRLEGINKYYHTYILISESTKKQLEKNFITREIDTIRVKGKHTPIKIYEVLGDEKDEHLLALKKHHESGLKSYYKKNWYEALCSFVQNESLLHDPVAKVFIDRINTFQQTPPPADWDGVWNFESK